MIDIKIEDGNEATIDAPTGSASAEISRDEYEHLTGETLEQTVDLDHWKRDIDVLKDYSRFEREVSEAESISAEVRKAIRETVFPMISSHAHAPKHAGIWCLPSERVEQTQREFLMNGLTEAVDGNVHVLTTMSLQIVQIAIVAANYGKEESS